MFGRKNKCRKIRRLLSDRVDEKLSARDERRVAQHLADCDECRQEYEFYRELKQAAAQMEMTQPPAHLWDRISVQVDEHPWGEDGRPAAARFPAGIWQGNLGLAGAVVALILVLIIGIMPAGQSGTVQPSDQAVAHETFAGRGIDALSLFLIAGGDNLPGEVRDYYIRHAEALERQIRTIKTALDQYPDNHQIQAQLAIAYGQKLQLYREVESATVAGGIIPGNFMIKFDQEDRRYE